MSGRALDAVLARRDVWRGGGMRYARTLPTGFDNLDERLGGGWPLGALIDCLPVREAVGEMALLLPALARVTQTRWVVFLDPPHLPYAPALAQAGVALSRLLVSRPRPGADWLWTAVQCLRSGACRAVCLWGGRLDDRTLRRLQLAAEEGDALAVLFRPHAAVRQSSPAMLRLTVQPGPSSGLRVGLLKCRGRASCTVDLPDAAFA